jgi:SAM-dependent methyltransferase
VFRLNDTPLEDQFLSTDTIAQPVYPLELAMCEDCGYLHLPHIVNPEASYADYVYVSGVTVGLRGHYDQYAEQIAADFKIAGGSLIVDLGSNDGSMLASFKRQGMKVVGVEPAGNIAALANQSGLTTINDFFTDEVASKIVGEYGQASVVTANYMYANIDDVTGFTKSVAKLLSPDGIFVVQTGYHPEQMKINMFDYIYHEHFSYFTVEVLKNLFSACGIELIDAQKMTPKGGSVRIIGQLKGGSRTVHASVGQLIAEERAAGMHLADTYRKFALDINESKNKLLELLKSLKTQGKKIAGFGASHSTTTLICHFELAPYIDYLVDDNKLKHGTYSPGYHLPVYPSAKLDSDQPDYVLILGWQHQNSIMEKHKLANNGRWIIPLPALQIV